MKARVPVGVVGQGQFGLSRRYWTLGAVLAAGAMAALGAAVVYLDAILGWPWKWSSDQEKFARDARFLVWLALILAQLALGPVIVSLVAERIREIREDAEFPTGGIVALAFLFGTGSLLVALAGAHVPDFEVAGREWLPGGEWKITAISIIVILIGLAPAVGIWSVQAALRTLAAGVGADDPAKTELDRLLLLKNALRTFLFLLGTLLTLAVVAAAAQRKAVEGWGQTTDAEFDVNTIFPIEYVTLYGLLFSILVALVYAPAHTTYLAVAQRFRDRTFPLVEPESDEWQTRLAKRKSFDELYELQSGTGANLKAAIVALAPLLASLTGLLGD